MSMFQRMIVQHCPPHFLHYLPVQSSLWMWVWVLDDGLFAANRKTDNVFYAEISEWCKLNYSVGNTIPPHGLLEFFADMILRSSSCLNIVVWLEMLFAVLSCSH